MIAAAAQDAKWKNGVVPYTIASSFSKYERGVIAKAMKEYHKNTCIKESLIYIFYILLLNWICVILFSLFRGRVSGTTSTL